MKEEFPKTALYTIGAGNVEQVDFLLTQEAVEEIKAGEAFGMALVEENELRAAACARILPQDDEILELLSLYVHPKHRRTALGGTLLMELLEKSMTVTEGNLRLAIASFMPDAEGMEALLRRAGFRIEQDESVAAWLISMPALRESHLLQHSGKLPAGHSLKNMGSLSDFALRQLLRELEKNEIADLSLEEMRESLQDLGYVLLDQKGEPRACALISKTGENEIALSQFYAAGGNVAAAMAVLWAAGRAILEQCPADTILEIPTLTETTANLVKKLIAGAKPMYMLRASMEL